MQTTKVLSSGGLRWDRQFAILDAQRQMVTAKRTAQIHSISAAYDLEAMQLTLSDSRQENCSRESFSLRDELPAASDWLSDYFDQCCTLVENTSQGFPDDGEALGPTVVSTATYEEVQRWFPEIPLDEIRRRFRANLEIEAPEPFWEDQLVSSSLQQPVRFQIGELEFFGMKLCPRCPVPTRDSVTGEVTPSFSRAFSTKREAQLPAYSPKERFEAPYYFYRLAVTTALAASSKSMQLSVGVEVAIC